MKSNTQQGRNQPNLEVVQSAPDPSSPPLLGASLLDGVYAVDPITAPNLDNRPSVLVELPKDLYVPGRGSFPVTEGTALRPVMFDRPKGDVWVMVHPDLERCRFLYCIKDKKARKFRPITESLLQQSPGLKKAARLYCVRQAKIFKEDFFLWPVPWFDKEDVPGDQKQRDAHFACQKDWHKIYWEDGDFVIQPTEEPFAFTAPDWSKTEDIDEAMKRAIGPLLLADMNHNFVRDFLGLQRPASLGGAGPAR
jgi:hypothetical protein